MNKVAAMSKAPIPRRKRRTILPALSKITVYRSQSDVPAKASQPCRPGTQNIPNGQPRDRQPLKNAPFFFERNRPKILPVGEQVPSNHTCGVFSRRVPSIGRVCAEGSPISGQGSKPLL